MEENKNKENINDSINVPILGRKRIALYPGSLGIYDLLNIQGQIIDVPILENYLNEDWDIFCMLPNSLINRFRAIQDTSISTVRNPRLQIEIIQPKKLSNFLELSEIDSLLNISDIIANNTGNFELILKTFHNELPPGQFLIRTRIKGTNSLRQSFFDLAFLATSTNQFIDENQIIGFGRLKIIPQNYNGYIVISDIDKTFLDTKIENREGLIETLLERIENKKSIKGMEEIYRILNEKQIPLIFISASPEFFRRTLEGVFKKYKISIDGLYLKKMTNPVNNITSKMIQIFFNFQEYINQNISEMMDRSIKFINTMLQSYVDQTAYKLITLLKIYKTIPPNAKLIFIGDNTESDFLIFILFQLLLIQFIDEDKIDEYLYNLKFKEKNIISRDNAILIKKLTIENQKIHEFNNPVFSIFIHRAYEKPDQEEMFEIIENTLAITINKLLEKKIFIPQIYNNSKELSIKLKSYQIFNEEDFHKFNNYYSSF